MVTEDQVRTWVEGYLRAWTSSSEKDIAALFTPQAEYHEWPYETDWIGRDAIVEGWQSRTPWQEGGWTFDWSLLTLNGDTAAIACTGRYKELGTFANLWTVTFDKNARCTMFRMWNNEI
ncbi:nuclear transport factor 2 family protein [Streptomyces sp. NPDC006691]|uniref:nuclear transport factor 2 family protein n=1 Tax=Streptomyces sp. NPDC006691 TaxID=3364757 RepID=UPI003683EA40